MEFIENQINNIVENFSSSPYLFVGSGFSRRYLELEDWEGLLRKFCTEIHPYEYYRSTCDNKLPEVAGKMSIDYNTLIWKSSDSRHIDFRNANKSELIHNSSALKISISEYLKGFTSVDIDSKYYDEIEDFKKISIEGIITTNWDNLLSELFPNFQTIIGQDQLLSSSTFGIGEIFKIHGCSTQSKSLILTNEDYKDFNKKNAYLASKLVTYFVEHPVIFIGYSLNDDNINEILTSIINCLGKANINQLTDNFIFVQRAKGDEKIRHSFKDIGGAHIPIIVIELNDYSKLYKSLSKIRKKLPVRLLRYLKEQLYEFVHTNDPKNKIAVIDIEDSTKVEKLEIAIGVGIIKQLGIKGYDKIKVQDIIEELLFEDKNYDNQRLVESTIPDLTGFIPIHYFVNSISKFDSSKLTKTAKTNFNRDLASLKTAPYPKQFEKNWKGKTIKDLIDNETDINKIMALIPCFEMKNIDKTILKEFLKKHFDSFFTDGKQINNPNTTFYRKAVCFYDYFAYNTI